MGDAGGAGPAAGHGEEILSTLSKELGWSHFVELLPMKEPMKREFYAEMCRVECWSVCALREKVGGMLYERTGLPRNHCRINVCKGHHALFEYVACLEPLRESLARTTRRADRFL